MTHATLAATDVRRLLRNVADTLTRLPYEGWHFGDSVAFEGMLAASTALDDERYAAFAHGFVGGWAARNDGFRPLDCTAPGLAMCRLYERTGDQAVLDTATALATYLSTARRPVAGVFNTWEVSPLRRPYGSDRLPADEVALLHDPGAGVFVDCLHFDPPFFAELGRVTGDARWTALAIEQALGYVRLLQDSASGLFHHFFLEKTGRDYVSGWGRGQGWALLGLLDVMEATPADTAGRADVVASARRLCTAMRAVQRPDGHWHAVVDSVESGDETSTAAFMALGFRRAIRLGVVPASEFSAPAEQAGLAAVSASDGGGVLAGVSAAVWACTMRSHYAHVPRGFVVPWGQGPLALLLADLLLHPETPT